MDSSGAGVLLVGTFLSRFKYGRGVCEDLAERLAAIGWRPICTSSERRRLARALDMVRTVWSRRHEYSVAHVDVYSGAAFVWAEMACGALSRINKPYVVTLRGGNLPDFARRRPSRVRRFLNRASAVTAPSRYLEESMRPYYSATRLLPNPLNLSAYDFRVRTVARPDLVWLRSFHQIYCPHHAPMVAASLVRDAPQVRLTMIGADKGDGSRERTEGIARELGVHDRIHLTGVVAKTEVPACLNRGDIFLNTTAVDNTPVSVMEAMACGLCVVSTNVGGIPYLLTHEHDALLVPPNDPSAMAAAVKRILLEPGLSEWLSRNARATVEPCDWTRVLPQWHNLLAGLAVRS